MGGPDLMGQDEASFIVDALQLPTAGRLDRRVYKKLLIEGRKISPADRTAVQEDIERIDWRFSIKPDMAPYQAVRTETFDFLELVVIEVRLREMNRTDRIASVVQRLIPYPVLLTFAFRDAEALNVAVKRFSQAEQGAIVVERLLTTPWIHRGSHAAADRRLLDALALPTIRAGDFRAVYDAYVQRVVSRSLSEKVDTYPQEHDGPLADLLSLYDRVTQIEADLGAQRRALSREKHFNRKVAIGAEIRRLESELEATLGELTPQA